MAFSVILPLQDVGDWGQGLTMSKFVHSNSMEKLKVYSKMFLSSSDISPMPHIKCEIFVLLQCWLA